MGARLTVAQEQPEQEPEDILRDYWAAAKDRYTDYDYPRYGTPEWRELPAEDPRKMAGLVAFAEMWRKYGDDITTTLNQAMAPPPLWQRATEEACAKAFKDILAQQRHRKEAA
ncbi:hypothetical protein ACFWH1_29390 [Streptomyces sp. NPDC127037]|uniref:hypothetical protein n=1 Tax=Streptomyces sp. NPDC127037 TaxID=3347113 RepID=UPI003651EF1A